jgi:hypothetical protein
MGTVAAGFHNPGNAGKAENRHTMLQGEPAEKITGEQWPIEALDAIGPAVLDVRHGQEDFKPKPPKLARDLNLASRLDLDCIPCGIFHAFPIIPKCPRGIG